MDFLNSKIKPTYFKYLSAAFGSAMITSVYSIVDTAMVGQYHGPEGTAALAVAAPVWNIIYTKTVGVEETGPRCPLFDFAERDFEIGAGE